MPSKWPVGWSFEPGKNLVNLTVFSGGRGHRGGVSEAAVELGVDRSDLRRGLRVAGLSIAAKEAAVRLGLEDNRTALVKASGAGGTADQIVSLEASAERMRRQLAPARAERTAQRGAESRKRYREMEHWGVKAAEKLFEWLSEERLRELFEMLDASSELIVIHHLRKLCKQQNLLPTLPPEKSTTTPERPSLRLVWDDGEPFQG